MKLRGDGGGVVSFADDLVGRVSVGEQARLYPMEWSQKVSPEESRRDRPAPAERGAVQGSRAPQRDGRRSVPIITRYRS